MNRDIDQVTYLDLDDLAENVRRMETPDLVNHVRITASKAKDIARVLNLACSQANEIDAVDLEGAVWALDDYLQDLSLSSSELGSRAMEQQQNQSEVA